jgi:hypothetical protein
MTVLYDWNAKPIETATSDGGTLLIANVFDALMRPTAGPWPPPPLVMQLGDGSPQRHPFGEELSASVSAPLGHYCAMQSINSEDALMWNWFGTLMAGTDAERVMFLNWLCDHVGLDEQWNANTSCAIDLWRRIPHPYYPSADGPELDAVLDGDRSVVFVEAKWLSPEGTGRGPDGTRVGQIHLRQRFFERWGRSIYGEDRRLLVLGMTLAGALGPDHGPNQHHIAVRSITWSELAAYDQHPNGDEFARHLAWKLRHSAGAGRLIARSTTAVTLAPAEPEAVFAASGGCVICEAEKHALAYACVRCKRILDRIETRRDADGRLRRFDREARVRAMREAWSDGAFHCSYTGIELVDDPARWRDHRYLAFEHQTPGDESSVVLTCALVNRMKTDLTHAEFRTLVAALASAFDGAEFDARAFPEGPLTALAEQGD